MLADSHQKDFLPQDPAKPKSCDPLLVIYRSHVRATDCFGNWTSPRTKSENQKMRKEG